MKNHRVYFRTWGVKQTASECVAIKAPSKQEALKIFEEKHSNNGRRYAVAIFTAQE
mgnify:CR=1 FL=1